MTKVISSLATCRRASTSYCSTRKRCRNKPGPSPARKRSKSRPATKPAVFSPSHLYQHRSKNSHAELLLLFQFGVDAFVVGLIDRSIRILILLAKNMRLFIERLREIKSPFALICFSETVVNVRGCWITFNVRLEHGNCFFGFTVED